MGSGNVPALELRNVLALSLPAVNGRLNDGPRASRGRDGGAGEDRTLERRGRATRAMAAIVGVASSMEATAVAQAEEASKIL